MDRRATNRQRQRTKRRLLRALRRDPQNQVVRFVLMRLRRAS